MSAVAPVSCFAGNQALRNPLRAAAFLQQKAMSEKDFKGELRNILFEGFLEKESRILKTWRRRWCVLTANYLFTFKEERQYSAPTEAIALVRVAAIKKSDEQTHREFSFRIETAEECFFVVATSNSEREKWLGSIGAAMMKSRRRLQEDEV